jgi:hydroxymethylglutaryl-CoA synthase
MIARAPGKLILCGEHAVVYGQPALAMAMDRYTECTALSADDDAAHLNLYDINHSSAWTPEQLQRHAQEIQKRYALFLEDKLDIRRVGQRSSDVPAYMVEMVRRLSQTWHPCRLDIHSTIPIGSGMGSSAALLTSMALALLSIYRLEYKTTDLLELVLAGERMYHGHPSGLDPYVTIHGGMIRFQKGEATPCPILSSPMYLVHTGKPASSTGECVQQVRQRYGQSQIWPAFGEVCQHLETAIRNSQHAGVREAVRANHRLLVQLGVVPAQVQEFITSIEEAGGAAKISGAGAVSGATAGMVLVFSDEPPQELCRMYGYPLLTIRMDEHGCRLS